MGKSSGRWVYKYNWNQNKQNMEHQTIPWAGRDSHHFFFFNQGSDVILLGFGKFNITVVYKIFLVTGDTEVEKWIRKQFNLFYNRDQKGNGLQTLWKLHWQDFVTEYRHQSWGPETITDIKMVIKEPGLSQKKITQLWICWFEIPSDIQPVVENEKLNREKKCWLEMQFVVSSMFRL